MTDTAQMPTPPGRKPRKTGPPRQPLGPELIVDTAIGVLDAEGLDAVSMRRVAQELGTGPASLYAHVSGKDELLELMLDRIAGEVVLPEPGADPGGWQEQLKAIARAARKVWLAHADIAKVSMGSIPTGPNVLAIAEAMLAVMRAAGVPAQIAAFTVDTIGMYLDADAIEATYYRARAAGGSAGDIENGIERHLGEIRAYFAALPAARFPTIVSMVPELTGGSGDERFEFGLDMLIRGVASYAGRDGAEG